MLQSCNSHHKYYVQFVSFQLFCHLMKAGTTSVWLLTIGYIAAQKQTLSTIYWKQKQNKKNRWARFREELRDRIWDVATVGGDSARLGLSAHPERCWWRVLLDPCPEWIHGSALTDQGLRAPQWWLRIWVVDHNQNWCFLSSYITGTTPSAVVD